MHPCSAPLCSILSVRPLLAGALLLGAGAAFAQEEPVAETETLWQAQEGRWVDAANWSDGKPGKATTARLSNGGTATLDGPGGTVLRVRVTDGSTLRVEPQGRLAFVATSNLGGGSIVVQGQVSSPSAALMVGSGTLRIESGGTLRLPLVVEKGGVSGFRVGIAKTQPLVVVDGGNLRVAGAVRIGAADDTQARLVLKNGGAVVSRNAGSLGLSGSEFEGKESWAFRRCTAEVIFGGEAEPEPPGLLENIDFISGHQDTEHTNTNRVIFNHSSPRFALRQSVSDEPVRLAGPLSVRVQSGGTVLEGANSYSGGTTIATGATLLANTEAAPESLTSATGDGGGEVAIEAGGTLGGTGVVRGRVVVSGTLKPGDAAADAPRVAPLTLRDEVELRPEGVLLITVAGADAVATLKVESRLNQAGTLAVELREPFALAPGQSATLPLFTARAVAGRFATTEFPKEWKGAPLKWALSADGSATVTATR